MAPAAKYSLQEQEDMILNAAADCICESSLVDFTMSAVSKAAGLSMGSIYKHVQCKEDIIFALAVKTFANLSEKFKLVLSLPITTPEKIIGISLLNEHKCQTYPFSCQLEGLVTNEAIIKRASPLWTERMMRSNEQCEQTFGACMQQAALNGELMVEPSELEAVIKEINLGCWALTVGHSQVQRVLQLRQISEGTDSLMDSTPIDAPVIKSLTRLLNSYSWKTPLTLEGINKVSELLIQHNLR